MENEFKALLKDLKIPKLSNILDTTEKMLNQRINNVLKNEQLPAETKKQLLEQQQKLKEAIEISRTDVTKGLEKINNILKND